jgi:CHAD domain-containing protein
MARGAALPAMSAEERHKLRIAFKNLRYGTDFFSALFNKREKVELYMERVADLQDMLGAQNDSVAAETLVDSVSKDIGSEASLCLGFILGWQIHQAKAKEEAMLKAWKNFRSAETFWG